MRSLLVLDAVAPLVCQLIAFVLFSLLLSLLLFEVPTLLLVSKQEATSPRYVYSSCFQPAVLSRRLNRNLPLYSLVTHMLDTTSAQACARQSLATLLTEELALQTTCLDPGFEEPAIQASNPYVERLFIGSWHRSEPWSAKLDFGTRRVGSQA